MNQTVTAKLESEVKKSIKHPKYVMPKFGFADTVHENWKFLYLYIQLKASPKHVIERTGAFLMLY